MWIITDQIACVQHSMFHAHPWGNIVDRRYPWALEPPIAYLQYANKRHGKMCRMSSMHLIYFPPKTFLTHERLYCHMNAILSIPAPPSLSFKNCAYPLPAWLLWDSMIRLDTADWHLSVIAGSRRQEATLTAQASLDPSLIVSHNAGLRFISANILIINWISGTNAVSCRYKHVAQSLPWGLCILKG